jgi:Transmembrane secretion effector
VVGVLVAWRREAEDIAGPPERFVGAVRAGFRYALFSRELLVVLLRAGVFSVASGGLMALMPVYATQVLHLGSGGLGLLLGGFGVGAVAAAAILPGVRERMNEDAVVTIGTLGVAAALLGLALTRSMPVALAIVLVGGAAWLLCLSTFNVASQVALPGWVRARGLAMYLTVFMGGVALGSAAWGYLAGSIGTPATFAWGALAVALTTSLAIGWRLHGIGEVNLSPAPMYAPEMRLMPRDASGPALVMITYEVQPGSEDAFQVALRRVGRARRRTGAVRWSVYRDADRPQRFIETFVAPSWDEHVRQHGRRTAADASLQLSLRAALVEGAEPQVAHFIAPPSPGEAPNFRRLSS